MKIERASCLEECATEGGNLVGRDPRQMGRDALQSAGLEPMTPMEVIRAKCLDCCAGSAREVRYCVAVDCPSWPYRMGSNPFRPAVSEERKAVLRASGFKMAVARAETHTAADFGEGGPTGLSEPGGWAVRPKGALYAAWNEATGFPEVADV